MEEWRVIRSELAEHASLDTLQGRFGGIHATAAGSAPTGLHRVTPQHICARLPTKESVMSNWLLLVWRKMKAWMMPGPAVPAHHEPVSEPYRPSNLHARRDR
jgi:hypothetical protein